MAHFTHLVRLACPFPLLEEWLRWWLNPLQRVRQGSQELPGHCWRTGKLLCPRINLSEGIKTQPQCSRQRVFTLQAPHFLFRKHTTISHSVFPQGSLLFVFVIIRLILTCLCDSTGVHTSIERGKTEVSIANLLKGKRDSHWFFPLWPDFHLENRILTLCVPEENDFFVCFKFRNGFSTGGMS